MEKKEPYRFVKKSYDRSDQWAISKVKEHLINNGYSIPEKGMEDYGLDIKAIKEGVVHYFECETKTGYPFTGADDFKFSTVSFLARKKKWAPVGFWYVIVCRETLAYVKCHSEIIYRDEFLEELEIDSKERQGTDAFYRVPKELCEWSNL